jgi:hypothetical protein
VNRLDAYVTSPGYEAALVGEIGRPVAMRWPGVVGAAAGEASGVRPQASGE